MPTTARRTTYTHSDLQLYARCPRSFQLHCIDRLPADTRDSALFAALLRRTCSRTLHEHVAERRSGGLEPSSVVAAYRTAWLDSGFTDPARFEEGLELVKTWGLRQGCVDWRHVLGIAEPFEVKLGDYHLISSLDRIERGDNRPSRLQVRALYSIAALARFGDVSTYVLRRVLRSNGVAFVRSGRALCVPMSEIRRKIPPLWESLQLVEELRRATAGRARA
jgi:hypothetical protein